MSHLECPSLAVRILDDNLTDYVISSTQVERTAKSRGQDFICGGALKRHYYLRLHLNRYDRDKKSYCHQCYQSNNVNGFQGTLVLSGRRLGINMSCQSYGVVIFACGENSPIRLEGVVASAAVVRVRALTVCGLGHTTALERDDARADASSFEG